MADNYPKPERPRSEPEIIPPDRSGRGGWPPDGYGQSRGTQRVFVGRVGPFGIALLMLGIAAIVGIILLVILGAVLLWIPVVVVAVIAAAIAGLFRRI
jgi:hypothetical protein